MKKYINLNNLEFKMRNVFLILIILISITFINAQISELPPVKINTCIDIPQSCSNCTYVNISTITDSASPHNVYYIEKRMTKTGNHFNYTFCNNSILGDYIIEMHGNPIGYDYNIPPIKYTVTQTGTVQTTSQGIASLGYLILIICLIIFLAIIGLKLSGNELLWVVGVFFMFFSLLLLIYGVYLGYEYYFNYTGANNTSNMPQILFYIFMFIIASGFLISGALLFTKWKYIVDYFKKAFKKDDSWDYDIEDDLKM